MRSLNLDQLRTLLEVVSLGSFSGAARRLNLTQPAISLHIRELEQRFGIQLIERRGRQAYPTAPGRELVEQATRVLSACEAAETAMRRFRQGWVGHVHVGTTLTALTYHLPPILRTLRKEHPGIELMVTNMPTRESVDGVLQNRLDLALVTLPVKSPRLRVTPLRREVLVAILPAEANDVPDIVTPEFAGSQPLVLEHTRGAVHALAVQWLGRHFPVERPPMYLGTIEGVKTLVGSGLGMSFVPDISVAGTQDDVVVRPLRPEVPCTLALIEQVKPPAGLAFEIVRKALLALRTS